ncbi:MAG: hypothetical protein Q6352_019420 [Candidatus Freyrarchaeum guaymaensis]
MLTRREPYRFSSRDFVDRKLKRLERRIRIGGSPAEPAGTTPSEGSRKQTQDAPSAKGRRKFFMDG